MRKIGFSTGALARGDVRSALRMLENKAVNAIEISALRQEELPRIIQELPDFELTRFKYKSFHAPSFLDPAFERPAVELLARASSNGWPIIVHPDAIHTPELWRSFGRGLCIENMDKRKPVGRTVDELGLIFNSFPEASFCFDVGHARQVNPTMSGAAAILHAYRDRLLQLHVSEVNAQSKHDPITLETLLACRRIAHLLPDEAPIIVESRVDESGIESELDNACRAFEAIPQLAIAGD